MGSLIVIALAGLPGAGKSTLAAALSACLRCPVLDKDRVRQALLGAQFTAYSRDEDDHCMELVYATVAFLAERQTTAFALIDGRTFLRRGQSERLVSIGSQRGFQVRFVLCTAPREEVLRRIESDRSRHAHPAANRTRALFEEIEREARPLAHPHCVVDTHALEIDAQVRQVLEWIGS